jgi:hypothetical protein
MADRDEGGDAGEVSPAEMASPAVADADPSLPTHATEGELVKVNDGSSLQAGAASSSNPEGLSLNYEVRNVVMFFLFVFQVAQIS